MNSCKRNIFTVVCLILIVFLFVVNVPIPIDQNISAIEIKLEDASYVESCEIRISGFYNINLLRESTFCGQISVSNYIWTDGKMLSPLYLDQVDGSLLEYSGHASSTLSSDSERLGYAVGRIMAKFCMKNPIILVYSAAPLDKAADAAKSAENLPVWGGAWSDGDGYCIVAGVSTREEAMEVLANRGII